MVLAAFVVSRILYYLAGIRFDATPVALYWQFIDPVLMRTRLTESLFYLHMQPPGFNLAIGLVVKFFPSSYSAVLEGIYLILGLLIAFLLLHLMRLFRVPEWIAATLTILFIVNPGCVLYENIAIYEYPILFLLLLAALALFRFSRTPTVPHSLEFFGCIFALVLVRNQFHLVYVLILAAALLAVFPRARRAVLVGALPVIVLILALYLKNWVLFHAFTASTWAGMNTGVVTTFQLTPEEADSLIRRGIVTPLAKIPPFSDLSLYAGLVETAPATGIPDPRSGAILHRASQLQQSHLSEAARFVPGKLESRLVALPHRLRALRSDRLVRVFPAGQRYAFVRRSAGQDSFLRAFLQHRFLRTVSRRQ